MALRLLGPGISGRLAIGDNAVIGLAAVVRDDVPGDRVVIGNPAVDAGPVPA